MNRCGYCEKFEIPISDTTYMCGCTTPWPIENFSWKTTGGYGHNFLSNFFVEPDLTTVEHDFQAEKTLDLRERVMILSADTPGEAKKLGRSCTLRPQWNMMRVHVMRGLVLRKFFDHKDLAEALVQTGDVQLVEGNHWGDAFWGVSDGKGENNLGIILMEVRDLIRSFG